MDLFTRLNLRSRKDAVTPQLEIARSGKVIGSLTFREASSGPTSLKVVAVDVDTSFDTSLFL